LFAGSVRKEWDEMQVKDQASMTGQQGNFPHDTGDSWFCGSTTASCA